MDSESERKDCAILYNVLLLLFLNFLYPHKSFVIDSFFLQILWKVLYTRPDNAWKQLL